MISFRESYAPPARVDWRGLRAVVFESDDWGACEYAPTRELWCQTVAETPPERLRPVQSARLECAADLKRLGDLLARHPGADGRPPVFTAFFCLANPDFSKIAATGEYHDLAIDTAFPQGWEQPGLPEAWREAARNGWLAPEFHTRFHHMNPAGWLSLLREESEAGREARLRFERAIYYQNQHLPEYAGLSPERMQQWLLPALETFRRLFGHGPGAGVTSDATPLTEVLWAANGIRTFCLRSFSIPGAEPIVYHTKPWNNQHAATPMGGWNPETDVIYLSRNIFFEPGFDPDYSFAKTMRDIEAVWARNEPAILSTHRLNYVAWDEGLPRRGFAALGQLLETLSRRGDVHFLTTAQVAALYRTGKPLL